MKKVTFLMLLGGIFLATSQAEVLTSLVGDMDNFGTNTSLGSPIRLVDTRWTSTDGCFDTNLSRWFSPSAQFNWNHTFALPGNAVIISAKLTIPTFDCEDGGAGQGHGSSYADVKLFLDNVEVAGAFDNVYTPDIDSYMYAYPNITVFNLSPSFFSLLTDSNLHVLVNANAGANLDYIAIDYSLLEITYIPEPATIILTGLGFLTVVRGRKR